MFKMDIKLNISLMHALTMATVLLSFGCGKVAFDQAPVVDSFSQKIKYNTKVDILFVIDTSGSMEQKQAEMADQFSEFVDWLASSNFDFQIGITTMDVSGSGAKGRLVGSPKILTKMTPDLVTTFQQNLSQGSSGSDLSRGLEALHLAMIEPLKSKENVGFFRSDSLLEIIFLSDEEDFSSKKSQFYIDFLNKDRPAFDDGTMSWVANSIVVPELTGDCTTYNQFASPGDRFMDLSKASSGAIESICEPNLLNAAAKLRARISERITQFEIDENVDPTTIKVRINGDNIAEDAVDGWTYHENGHVVKFHGKAIPPAKARVEISYKAKPISGKKQGV